MPLDEDQSGGSHQQHQPGGSCWLLPDLAAELDWPMHVSTSTAACAPKLGGSVQESTACRSRARPPPPPPPAVAAVDDVVLRAAADENKRSRARRGPAAEVVARDLQAHAARAQAVRGAPALEPIAAAAVAAAVVARAAPHAVDAGRRVGEGGQGKACSWCRARWCRAAAGSGASRRGARRAPGRHRGRRRRPGEPYRPAGRAHHGGGPAGRRPRRGAGRGGARPVCGGNGAGQKGRSACTASNKNAFHDAGAVDDLPVGPFGLPETPEKTLEQQPQNAALLVARSRSGDDGRWRA